MTDGITQASIEDTAGIMHFIDSELRHGHILGVNKPFFLYQYRDGDKLTFLMSKDSSGRVNGLLGYIKASSVDSSDVWASIWKVSGRSGNPILGIEMLNYLREMGFRSVTSLGINPKTIGIYDYLGIFTDSMSHYVIFNHLVDSFAVAKLSDKKKIPAHDLCCDDRYSLVEMNESEVGKCFDFERFVDCVPYKDFWYFSNRYFKHPSYEYVVYGIMVGDAVSSLIVTRVVKVDTASVLRIVDYIGPEEDLVYVSKTLYEIVVGNGFEYVDFLNYGFDDGLLRQAGFMCVDLDSEDVVVPNYFSPFLRENVKIHICADVANDQQFRMCKADGDQDRPN
jgi:hypothetical protein